MVSLHVIALFWPQSHVLLVASNSQKAVEGLLRGQVHDHRLPGLH